MTLPALMVLTAGLLVGADAKDDAVKAELKKFEGAWQLASLEMDGEKVPAETTKTFKLVFAGEKFMLKSGDETIMEGVGKVDPTQKPRAVDITPSTGDEKGKTLKGIYELDGDTLKICLGSVGKDRPKEFVAKKDAVFALVTCKRDKK